jgi:hypothetical protein
MQLQSDLLQSECYAIAFRLQSGCNRKRREKNAIAVIKCKCNANAMRLHCDCKRIAIESEAK